MSKNRKNIKVLLVEEDPHTLVSLVDELSRLGFQVFPCSSTGALTETLLSGPFDVSVVDTPFKRAVVPDFLQELRNGSPDSPVILLTPPHALDIALEAVRQGAFDFLLRPVTLGELAAKIWEASNLKRTPVPAL